MHKIQQTRSAAHACVMLHAYVCMHTSALDTSLPVQMDKVKYHSTNQEGRDLPSDCLGCCCVRRELDKGAANSWGFQAPSERRQPAQKASTLPTEITRRQAGPAEAQLGSPSRLYDESAAAQQAFKREALSRRLHDKEFHAKQSIRKRQQEYNQAVKARLAQDCAVSSDKGSGSTTRSHMGAKHAQQLPELAATSGAILLSGPRAKKLQAFVRHPRPPQLPTPPRQLSRMPDDILLPDINSRDSVQRPYIINDDMADLLVDESSQPPMLSTHAGSKTSLLPTLGSQGSMRRLTQELPS